jgi:hypothetical protein
MSVFASMVDMLHFPLLDRSYFLHEGESDTPLRFYSIILRFAGARGSRRRDPRLATDRRVPVQSLMHTPDPQDLHLHTTLSSGDGSVVPEQTLDLVASVRHAEVVGCSDHLDSIIDGFEAYARAVRAHGMHVGTEVDGADWVDRAVGLPVEYYVYHCRDREEDYRGAAALLATGKPLIIAHPQVFKTDPSRLPEGCLIEINNRYSWQYDGEALFKACIGRFEFVISSDAHQPHWLNQNVARAVAARLGIRERLLFG